tara:strand:+ start:72 stop:320 length:249 start_codon:yes stop_codon:yes gene_type:complete
MVDAHITTCYNCYIETKEHTMTYFTKFNVSFNCELDCTIEEAQALFDALAAAHNAMVKKDPIFEGNSVSLNIIDPEGYSVNA